MRRLGRVVAAGALAVTAVGAAPAALASAQREWRLTAVVRPCGAAPAGLQSVTAVSATEAWAVGNVVATHCAGFVEHWNGRSWRTMKIGSPVSASTIGAGLQPSPIAATSASDVWVFPVSGRASGILFGADFAQRWDGHRWHASRFPVQMAVTAAAAFSARNVWAFGYRSHGPSAQVPYVARYNGSRWRTARLPGRPVSADAAGLRALWAVGASNRTAAEPVRKQTLLAMRWTGTRWTSFALPPLPLPASAVAISGHLVAVSRTEFWWQYQIVTTGSAPDRLGLLHCIAGRCQDVRLPPNAIDAQAAATDGRGGLVIAVMDENQHTFSSWQEWYDYAGGHWAGRVQLSPRRYTSTYFALAWVPGTESAWSAGEADASSGSARVLSEGVIARFGS